MYKVFVNDNALFLTNEVQKETDFQVFLWDGLDLKKIINKLYTGKIQKAYLYHPDEELMYKELKKLIPRQKAAGGLVSNAKGEILFIFRNGKWDLPKGGVDKGESNPAAALREVEEETGVGELTLGDKLAKTYHIFKRNGRYRLKVTHWYHMTTTYDGPMIPQQEEGIEKVAWLKPEEIEDALKKSYRNIRLLFKDYAL